MTSQHSSPATGRGRAAAAVAAAAATASAKVVTGTSTSATGSSSSQGAATSTSASTPTPTAPNKPREVQICTQSFKIITQYGDMLVVKQGVHLNHNHHHHHHLDQVANAQSRAQDLSGSGASVQSSSAAATSSRPIIMTFHDLGLNSELQFASFCECEEVRLMMQTFTMIHVNFIGQESPNNASGNLPDNFRYPTMEQMAECIVDICTQLRVRSFVALAVGAGAHIVSVLALQRPDLVHGLFLINPIISSCSIGEWLYFKMSAIASNHHINEPQPPPTAHSNLTSGPSSPSSASAHAKVQHQQSSSATSGFRKLLNAAHIGTGGGGSGSQQQNHQRVGSSSPVSSEPASRDGKQVAAETSSNKSTEDLQLLSSPSIGSNSVRESPAHHPTSRLRRLILSRNFRLNLNHHHHHQRDQSSSGSMKRTQSFTNRPVGGSTSDADASGSDARKSETSLSGGGGGGGGGSGKGLARITSRGSNKSQDSATSYDSLSSSGTGSSKTKRPPLEYLMHHHFGSTTLQRYRRPSADGGSTSGEGGDSPNRRQVAAKQAALELLGQAAAADLEERRSNGSRHSSKSHDSLIQSTASNVACAQRRKRSNSVGLTASYLASFSSERQRSAYMQSVYKQYFSQLNSHNLWLFAQSFVKRKTLNLRKDCGAAAHAAAAAAALGTSIYTAFVGVAPPSSGYGQSPVGDSTSQSSGNSAAFATQNQSLSGHQHTNQQQQHHNQTNALVAGTKVKRTFTCQTLIMCSNVQMHSERSFKLMSLLNPLQATLIKTDQLLVLEEKPEKVCQALRLFLQGIGYSMSTYERRLCLSSAQGSVSSASSIGSGRSLSDSKVVC